MLIFGLYISYIIEYNIYVQKNWCIIFIEFFIAETIYATYYKNLFNNNILIWLYEHHIGTIIIWMYTTKTTYEFKWIFIWHSGTIIYYIQRIIQIYRTKTDKKSYYIILISYILQRLWRITIFIISYISLKERPILIIWTFMPGIILDIYGAILGYKSLKKTYKKIYK